MRFSQALNGVRSALVVGNPVGARFPHEVPQMLQATLPGGATLKEILDNPGRPFDPTIVRAASREIDQFIKSLEGLGIHVLQPQVGDDFLASPIERSAFRTNSGLYAAMPRDNLLLLPPNLVVLAPMAWRSRYREHEAYRDVLKSLEKLGLKVIEAPRPGLADNTYVSGWTDQADGVFRPVINNHEPLFDAADFIRFGDHIIGQLSHVTNIEGVRWIRSVMPSNYRLHIIDFADEHPMHIDATLMPLQPGKVIVHPERVPPELRVLLNKVLLRGWRMVEAPRPNPSQRDAPLYFTSRWINMNILVGDQWAFIEQKDAAMAHLLKSEGVEPIPQPLQHFQALGGPFHCCTMDAGRSAAPRTSGISQARDLHIYFDRNDGKYKIESLESLFSLP